MPQSLTHAISFFGDSAALLPASLALAAYLWMRRSPAAALAWFAPLAACLGALALVKVVGHACGIRFLGSAIVSPSGHAAFSAGFYGSLGVLVGRSLTGWRRHAVHAGAALLVVAVAVTRVLLDAHSVAEVLIGLAFGAAATLIAARLSAGFGPLPKGPPPFRLAGLTLAGILLGLLVYEHNITPERVLGHIGWRLRTGTSVCTALYGPEPLHAATDRPSRERAATGLGIVKVRADR